MITIRRMTIDDLPLGLGLSRQAGWNQIESDWRRFMSMEPEGCFVAELDGLSVGTTTTCVFGHQVAWIAMVLVERSVRGKGIGTSLLKHALSYLKERKVGTVRLDATSAGRPIYEKLGFVPEYELARYEGVVKDLQLPTADCRLKIANHKSKIENIIEFDRRMTGTDREKMLSRLFEEFPELVRYVKQGDKVEGYIAGRPGANAIQVGPCIAMESVGPSLLSDALSRYAGKPVFVDIPLDNSRAVKIAESGGLKVQRCFTRMCLGERIKDNIQAIWTCSGPEKG